MRRVVFVAVVLGGSCRALLGPLEECVGDAECGSATLACVNRLCVQRTGPPPLDPRCTRQLPESPVRFASILAKTFVDGGHNPTGVARERGLLVAIEQLNPPVRRGVGDGLPIELITCDNGSSADVTTELASHVIAQGAQAVFTGASAETLAASRVTVASGVLLMSVSATTPELTDLPDRAPGADAGEPGLVWRTSPSDTFQGRVLAGELVDAGAPRVAVIQVNDTYGQGLYGTFSRAYPTAQRASYLFPRGGDVTAALDAAESYSPDVALIIAFPDDAVRIVNGTRTRARLSAARLVFTDSAKSPRLFDGLSDPSVLEGALGSAPASATGSDAFTWFRQQYQQQYSQDPTSVSGVSSAFDAAMCLALSAHVALQPGRSLTGLELARGLTRLYRPGALKVALDPPRFNTAARELEQGRDVDVEGASGALDFDPLTGEAPGGVDIWRVTDGGFQTVKTVFP